MASVRWVQKLTESGEPPRYFSLVVRDVVPVGQANASVSVAEAARLVSTGEWK